MNDAQLAKLIIWLARQSKKASKEAEKDHPESGESIGSSMRAEAFQEVIDKIDELLSGDGAKYFEPHSLAVYAFQLHERDGDATFDALRAFARAIGVE
jgi:hypothetical protein